MKKPYGEIVKAVLSVIVMWLISFFISYSASNHDLSITIPFTFTVGTILGLILYGLSDQGE